MQTSTRSAIGALTAGSRRGHARARASAVREVGVAVRRGARDAHHLVARRRCRSSRSSASPATQKAANGDGGRGLPDEHVGLLRRRGPRRRPRRAWRRGGRGTGRRAVSERASSSARNAGASASKPISGLVEEEQRVRLDGARLGVDAGDRERVDLVAEIGRSALRPGIIVSAKACSVASVGVDGRAAAGATAASIRSAAGSADSDHPAEAEHAMPAAGLAARQQFREPDRVQQIDPALPSASILPRREACRLRRAEYRTLAFR